jgi:serine/arginine repetitive matrix protein 1
MQIYLTGFMESKTAQFVEELWALMLEAQESETGVPQKLIEERNREIEEKRLIVERAKK